MRLPSPLASHPGTCGVHRKLIQLPKLWKMTRHEFGYHKHSSQRQHVPPQNPDQERFAGGGAAPSPRAPHPRCTSKLIQSPKQREMTRNDVGRQTRSSQNGQAAKGKPQKIDRKPSRAYRKLIQLLKQWKMARNEIGCHKHSTQKGQAAKGKTKKKQSGLRKQWNMARNDVGRQKHSSQKGQAAEARLEINKSEAEPCLSKTNPTTEAMENGQK